MVRRFLVLKSGPEQGRRYEIAEGEVSIGRDSSNQMVITDPQVSRRHASLRAVGSELEVRDLGSTNGTFLNGQRVTNPRLIRKGDSLRLGQVQLVFEVEIPLPAAPPAEEVGRVERVDLPQPPPLPVEQALPPPLPPPLPPRPPRPAPPPHPPPHPAQSPEFVLPDFEPEPSPEPVQVEVAVAEPPVMFEGIDSAYARRVVVAAVVLAALIVFVIAVLIAGD